jgi:hypothetical protein
VAGPGRAGQPTADVRSACGRRSSKRRAPRRTTGEAERSLRQSAATARSTASITDPRTNLEPGPARRRFRRLPVKRSSSTTTSPPRASITKSRPRRVIVEGARDGLAADDAAPCPGFRRYWSSTRACGIVGTRAVLLG